jgi:hypothetical protein
VFRPEAYTMAYDVLRTIDYPVVDIMALKDFAEMLKQ